MSAITMTPTETGAAGLEPMEQARPELEPEGPKRPGVVRRGWRWLGSVLDWIFGLFTLLVGLAFLSVIPVLNLLSLGYLLQAGGNVAVTGRFRDGFIGVRRASLLGSMVLGGWLCFWPVRFVSGLWQDANLVSPGSAVARQWHLAVILLTVLTVVHVVWACLRGGRFRHFLWPAPLKFLRWVRGGGVDDKFERVRDSVWDYVAGLRLPHYFWLGLRGFAGAVIWLVVPVGILILASGLSQGLGFLLSLVGALLLMGVVLYLPFLQVHFVVEGRFKALFEVGRVRALFRRAPLAFWLALLITLLFALPLYLLKIELTPQEVAWLPSLLFVAFIFPARLLTGWAISRGNRRETPRHGIVRWLARLSAVPVVGVYVLLVYFTQYLSWHGTLSLLEQHAFLVPAPLMSF